MGKITMTSDDPEVSLGMVEVMLLGSSITNLMSSGAGVREQKYYEALAKKLRIRLFQYSPSESIDNGCGPIPYKNKWLHSILGVFRFAGYYRARSINVVRSKQLWGSWAGWLLAMLLRKPHVIRCGYIWSRSFTMERGIYGLLKRLIEYFEVFLIRRADAYIFCSSDIESFYGAYIGNKPYIVLPNYVDKTQFFPDLNLPQVKQFFYLGRLIELKGVEEAACFVDRLGEAMNTSFVGQGPLEEKVSAMGISIIPSIPNDQLGVFMNTHKYVVSFSKTEGSPKALLEAVFCGLYPVLSDIPVHREIVDKLGYGVIVKNPSDLNFDVDSPRHIVLRDNLEHFTAEYSLKNHIEVELEFLADCANKTNGRRKTV
jgi:glycosyltransferase involved in cell wall biosynthesis